LRKGSKRKAMTKAASEAEQLLEDLGLTGLPIIPKDVCVAMSSDSYQITLEEQSMNTEGFHGVSMGNAEGAVILVNSNIPNRHRKRFTAAHEIGHVHLHIQTNIQSQFECTSDDISSGENNNKKLEKEANVFASSLLMPASTVSPIVRRNDLTWPLIQKIASKCDVSLEAAARRSIALSDEACCLIVHKNFDMWSPIKSRTFTAYIPKQLFPPRLETQPDLGQSVALVNNSEECDLSDWNFPDSAAGKLLYSSIQNKDYNRTMTLLIHEEEIEDNEVEFSDAHF